MPFVLKLLATLALSAWIVAYLDWTLFGETVRGAHLGLLGVVVALRFSGVAISSWKWGRLLAIHGVHRRFSELVRLYLVATFLNHFLPTSIGGDAYRVYQTLNNQRSRACAVFAVFMERATGFLALLILGAVSSAVLLRRADDPVAAVVLATCLVGIGAAAVMGLLGNGVAPIVKRMPGGKWTRWVGQVPGLIQDYRQQPGSTVAVGGLSFLFHANKLVGMWLLILALGHAMDPLALILAITGTEVVGLLPVTLGGLGLMDGSFIYLAGNFGLAAEVALAAMLLHRVLNLPLSFAGAWFYAVGERRPPDLAPSATGPVASDTSLSESGP